MKTLPTVVFICMLFSAVFQASAALRCYECMGTTCDPKIVTCSPSLDTCQSTGVEGLTDILKGCITKEACDVGASTGLMKCCQTDLCNGAEGVKLSLLIMLVPLISSNLFL